MAEVEKTGSEPTTETASGRSLPVCTAMVFCSYAFSDARDNTISAIRIMDTITLPTAPHLETEAGLEFAALTLLAILKNGEARGNFNLLLICVAPSGHREPIGAAEVRCEGEPTAGSNLMIPVRLHWEGAGLYWLELQVDSTVLARSPIRVLVATSHSSKETGQS